jgi:hypothetical protein
VNPRTRAWLLILVVTVVCGLAVWGVVWYRTRPITPAAMLRRLPADGAVVLYVDFAALRRGGILQLLKNSKVGEDPEYRRFVQKIDFDYQQDLDAAMVAFAPTGKFMLLRGRFDWSALSNYVRAVDGKCNNSFCRMTGSTPERRISFYPVQPGIMALAVSEDESAAERIAQIGARPEREIPSGPIWLSIPPSIVHSPQSLPAGAQMFARPLERAQNVTLELAPEGGGFVARLNVRCANPKDASDLAADLERATSLLRDLIAREHTKPNPADTSGFFASGTFRSEGPKVQGFWRIERSLIEALFSGA